MPPCGRCRRSSRPGRRRVAAGRGNTARSGSTWPSAPRRPGAGTGGYTNGGTSYLRLRADAKLPHHKHPGWEQALVLEGTIRIGKTMLHPGDYLFAGAGDVHDAEAFTPTILLVCSEKGVEYF